jgi:prephenate dehydrogenase
VTVVGVGLIGGSLAGALREAGLAGEIIGTGRSAETLRKARDLGLVDRYETRLDRAVKGSQLVVLAAPVGVISALMANLAGCLEPDALLTDTGSVKGDVVAAARRHLGECLPCFVPGHPVAGTERSGPEAAFPELYRGHMVILTPVAETLASATARIRALWTAVGARVIEMSVADHDRILAMTSHLPHMLAYALVDHLVARGDDDRCFDLAAGGFYDFTRIASSDPAMWRDICLHNRAEIASAVRELAGSLERLAGHIEEGDGATLFDMFRRARDARAQVADRRRGRAETRV